MFNPWETIFFQDFTKFPLGRSVWVIVHSQPPNSSLSSCQHLMPAVEASPSSGWPQQDSPQPSEKCFLTPPALSSAVLGLARLCSRPPAFRCRLGILSNHRAASTLAVLHYPHFCTNLLMPQWGGSVGYGTWASPCRGATSHGQGGMTVGLFSSFTLTKLESISE